MTVSAFKDITAKVDVYENRHYLWDTVSSFLLAAMKCAFLMVGYDVEV
jgi:hypothetical protein